MALRLEAALGTSAEMWLGMQMRIPASPGHTLGTLNLGWAQK